MKLNYELIKLIAYDFDGVMTDNRVQIDDMGKESVLVNRSDGLAINLIKTLGIEQIILSTEVNEIVKRRAEKLKINCINGVHAKAEVLINYCISKEIDLKNVVFLGNDLNDLEVMNIVGYPICPNDAAVQVKKSALYILKTNGGYGCIREFYDLIINQQ